MPGKAVVEPCLEVGRIRQFRVRRSPRVGRHSLPPVARRQRPAAPAAGSRSCSKTATAAIPPIAMRQQITTTPPARPPTTSGIRRGNDRRSAGWPCRRPENRVIRAVPMRRRRGSCAISNDHSTRVPPSPPPPVPAAPARQRRASAAAPAGGQRLDPEAERHLPGERQVGQADQFVILDKDTVQRRPPTRRQAAPRWRSRCGFRMSRRVRRRSARSLRS